MRVGKSFFPAGFGGLTANADLGDVRGIFDHEFLNEADTETRVPVFTCATADVISRELRKGSQLVISNETYKVRRHEPDGTGMSRLILEQ